MAEQIYGPKVGGVWPAPVPLTGGARTAAEISALPSGTVQDAIYRIVGKNLLINANFIVNQRGYVSGTATGVANFYSLDRWRVVTSGQNLTFTASGAGNQITAPAGGVEQVVEDLNVDGGTYVLSWTGTATATVNGSAVTNGGTVTLTAKTAATVRFSGGTVSKAQLEAGTTATAFERRSFGLELALCLRYYFANLGGSPTNSLFGQGFCVAINRAFIQVPLPVPMRTIPTVTLTGAGTWAITSAIANAAVSSLVVNSAYHGTLIAAVDATTTTSPFVSKDAAWLMNNSGAPRLGFDAEL